MKSFLIISEVVEKFSLALKQRMRELSYQHFRMRAKHEHVYGEEHILSFLKALGIEILDKPLVVYHELDPITGGYLGSIPICIEGVPMFLIHDCIPERAGTRYNIDTRIFKVEVLPASLAGLEDVTGCVIGIMDAALRAYTTINQAAFDEFANRIELKANV